MPYTFAGEYADDVNSLSGRPLRNAPITVLKTDLTAATLYSSRLKSATVSNVVDTDSVGNLHFFADPGPYVIRAASGVSTRVVVPIDPEEADLVPVTSVNGQTGVVVLDFVPQGGPLTDDLDAAGFDLTGVGQLVAVDTAGAGGTETVSIEDLAQAIVVGGLSAEAGSTVEFSVEAPRGFAFVGGFATAYDGSIPGSGSGTAEIAAEDSNTFAFGYARGVGGKRGRLAATNDGAHAGGNASGFNNLPSPAAGTGGLIEANGPGSFAHGRASGNNTTGDGQIVANGSGSFALGQASGGDGHSTIRAAAHGSIAAGSALENTYGIAPGTATVETSGSYSYGAVALGGAFSSGGTSKVRAAAGGAIALGYATGSQGVATVEAGSQGAVAMGKAFALNAGGVSELFSTGYGAIAQGYSASTLGSSQVWSSGYGSLAQGYTHTQGHASASAMIRGGGYGGFGQGYAAADASGSIARIAGTGYGTFAQGYAKARSAGRAFIESFGSGSFAMGSAYATGASAYGKITASSSYGSLAFGNAVSHAAGRTAYIQSDGGGVAFGSADAVAANSLIRAADFGALAAGRAKDGTILASGKGALAQGYSFAGTIQATDDGSMAQGYANASTIQATSPGSFAHGYANNGGLIEAINPLSMGSFVHGYAVGAGSLVRSSGRGGVVFGYTYNIGGTAEVTTVGGIVLGKAAAFGGGTARVVSTNAQGFAIGYAFGNGAGIDGRVEASQGFATGVASAEGADATILASGGGAFTHGSVRAITGPSAITASGSGAFAGGYSNTNRQITASGFGAVAHGFATGGDIIASANNAVQFGPGTNAEANSLKVGGGIHILGTAGAAPAAPTDGMFWVDAGGVVKVRTAGVTRNVGVGA